MRRGLWIEDALSFGFSDCVLYSIKIQNTAHSRFLRKSLYGSLSKKING